MKSMFFQLQAGIAAEHALARDFESTNWGSIYKQYLILEQLDKSVIVKFNKCIARFLSGEKNEALDDLLQLEGEPGLNENPHFHMTAGVFYDELEMAQKALVYFRQAFKLSNSEKERVLINKKILNIDLT